MNDNKNTIEYTPKNAKISMWKEMFNKVPEVTVYFWIIKNSLYDSRRDVC